MPRQPIAIIVCEKRLFQMKVHKRFFVGTRSKKVPKNVTFVSNVVLLFSFIIFFEDVYSHRTITKNADDEGLKS